MPVYPCAQCGGPVDPTLDKACRGCSNDEPYDCSRCNKRMGTDEVFQLEKLKTKKPLLCMGCGESGEVVKCKICKLSLVRASGKTLSSNLGAHVYHPACLERTYNTIALIKKMALLAVFLGFGLGYLMLANLIGTGQVPAGLICGGIFGAATYMLAVMQVPK